MENSYRISTATFPLGTLEERRFGSEWSAGGTPEPNRDRARRREKGDYFGILFADEGGNGASRDAEMVDEG